MARSLLLLALCGLAVPRSASADAVSCDGAETAEPNLSSEFCEIHAAESARIVRVLGGSYDRDDPRSVPNQLHPDHLPAKLDFGRLELSGAIDRTDVLSVDFLPPFGLLVSERAKLLLDQFNVGPHVTYPVTILYRGQEHAYFWIQLVPEKTPIDFAHSTFAVHYFEGADTEGEIKFASTLEIDEHAAANDVEISPKAIVLSQQARSSDLLGLPSDLGVYVSKRLVRAIRSAGLTGFELTATRKIYTSDDWNGFTASLP